MAETHQIDAHHIDARQIDAGQIDAGQPLSLVEESVLAFAARWWRTTGARDEALHTDLGLTPVRYFQILNRLLDDDRAMQRDPLTVQRLRRVRDLPRHSGG